MRSCLRLENYFCQSQNKSFIHQVKEKYIFICESYVVSLNHNTNRYENNIHRQNKRTTENSSKRNTRFTWSTCTCKRQKNANRTRRNFNERMVDICKKTYLSYFLKHRGRNCPLNYKTMDLIFLIVITPITIAVMFVYWKLKQYFNDFDNLPEASPYQFERDKYIPEFDTYTKAIYKHKFYKGKNK